MLAGTAENAKPESPLTTPARNSTTAMVPAATGLKLLPMCRLETSDEPTCNNAKARSSATRDAIAIPATEKVAMATARLIIGACLTALLVIFLSSILARTATLRWRQGARVQTGNFEIRLIYRSDELFLSVRSAFGPSQCGRAPFRISEWRSKAPNRGHGSQQNSFDTSTICFFRMSPTSASRWSLSWANLSHWSARESHSATTIRVRRHSPRRRAIRRCAFFSRSSTVCPRILLEHVKAM
jgi:hypothetical protein